jgi:hypothetical protein
MTSFTGSNILGPDVVPICSSMYRESRDAGNFEFLAPV